MSVFCFSYFLRNPNGKNWDGQNFSQLGLSAEARKAKLTCGKKGCRSWEMPLIE